MIPPLGFEKAPRRLLHLLAAARISHAMFAPSSLAALCDWIGEFGYDSTGDPDVRCTRRASAVRPPRP